MSVATETIDLHHFAGKTYMRCPVAVQQYASFRRDGVIVFPQLVPADDARTGGDSGRRRSRREQHAGDRGAAAVR